MTGASPTAPASPPRNARQPAGFSAPFGIPLGDLGFLTSLLFTVGSAFAAFFLTTFVAILGLLATSSAQHPANFAASYREFGLPAGCIVGVLALAYFGTLWIRRALRRS